MLTPLDVVVLVVYAVGVVAFGLRAGGTQRTTQDYFLGGRDLPWWAVCFSIVATETSTLTVIGVPAVAYLGSLTFLQLTIGYILGRVVVAAVLLPRYFRGVARQECERTRREGNAAVGSSRRPCCILPVDPRARSGLRRRSVGRAGQGPPE